MWFFFFGKRRCLEWKHILGSTVAKFFIQTVSSFIFRGRFLLSEPITCDFPSSHWLGSWGVLDIFGFECFKMNSFEQLGILRQLEPSGYSSKIGVCVLLFLGSTEFRSVLLFAFPIPKDPAIRWRGSSFAGTRIAKRWSEPDGHQ